MSKSILIVICDFLVLSLLALARFDDPPNPAQQTNPPLAAPTQTQAQSGQEDLLQVLKTALQNEEQTREDLSGELKRSQEAIRGQQELLSQRETQVGQLRQDLQGKEDQAQRLDQERGALQQQMASTRVDLAKIQQQLNVTTSEAQAAKGRNQELQDTLRTQKESTATLQAALRTQQENSTALQRKLTQLEKSHHSVLAEKQQLATRLQTAETEKRLTREQLASLQGEVQTVRAEKAQIQEHAEKLAEGVGTLAEKSAELTQEIRENRPLAPNTIFGEFITNRAQARFRASRSGAFGQPVDRDKATQTLLVTDGKQTYALFHVDDTPLTFSTPGTEWRSLTTSLHRGPASAPLRKLSFSSVDPRLLFAPVEEADAKRLNARVYQTTSDPFKFQDVVIIGANETYYGECRFQIDANTPQYVKVDRSIVRGLFGKFNPSRGDLAFTKTGEVLGIMVNNDYCAVLGQFNATRTIQLGDQITTQHTAQLLSQFHSRVFQMPFRLQ